jgi:hypothetical protein
MVVSNSFLHEDLEEEVYMALSPRYVVPQPNLVCRLQKPLYGLRQASRNWYGKLSNSLLKYAFNQPNAQIIVYLPTPRDKLSLLF